MPLSPKITYTNEFMGLHLRRPVAMKGFHFNCRNSDKNLGDLLPGAAFWRRQCVDCDHEAVVPHNHDFYEIAIMIDGGALHYNDVKEEMVGPGTILIIPPGVCHGFRELAGLRKVNMYYITEWLADDLQLLWRQEALVPLFLGHMLFQPAIARTLQHPTISFRCDPKTLGEILEELRAIQEEMDAPDSSLVYIQAAFLKVLVRMSQAFTRMNPDWQAGRAMVRKEVVYVLREVEECIDGNRKFDMREVARSLDMTQEYVCRLFKQATGRPPMEYYQYRRIQQGARRLLLPEASVTEIAHELGFCDASHFSRQFRRYMGKEPREYRKIFQTGAAEPPWFPMDL